MIVKTISTDYGIPDIMRETVITINHPWTQQIADILIDKLELQQDESSLHRLFDWVKANITYKEDEPKFQDATFPHRTILQGYGDCKKQSAIITSVTKRLGLKPYLKLIFYADENGKLLNDTHLYTVVPLFGNWFIIDTVADQINFEFPHAYYEIYDHSGNKIYSEYMPELRRIAGKKKYPLENLTGNSITVGNSIGWTVSERIAHATNRVILSPFRGGMVVLVKNNYKNLAEKLATSWNNGYKDELREKWYIWGGQPDNLRDAIIQGSGVTIGIELTSLADLTAIFEMIKNNFSAMLKLFDNIFEALGLPPLGEALGITTAPEGADLPYYQRGEVSFITPSLQISPALQQLLIDEAVNEGTEPTNNEQPKKAGLGLLALLAGLGYIFNS